tara:strand:- start:999 stop:1661 length:663 start_codon:yes stop_codon:yes gene_type:complete
MTSRVFVFWCLALQITMSDSIDIIEHCTDIHVLPHDTAKNAIDSAYQCFHATRKFEIPFEKIEDALLGPITGLVETTNKYEKMQVRITEQDFDSRRKLRDLQKEFVQLFFSLETKIHQIELPQLYHATLEHIFFKVENFLQTVNETVAFVVSVKKSILRYKHTIQNMFTNVTTLNVLRENRVNAREHFETALKEFRSKVHAEYDERLHLIRPRPFPKNIP